MNAEWTYDEILRPTTWDMSQETHADASPGVEDGILTVRRCNGGLELDQEYICISLVGEWAFNDAAEIDAFCEKLKSTLP